MRRSYSSPLNFVDEKDFEHFDDTAEGATYWDFGWYAVDSAGHIAFLTSAGFGPVPSAVFSSKDKYIECLEYFRDRQETTQSNVARGTGKLDDWINASKRGLFGYDWDWHLGQPEPNKPYRIITSPKKPLHISEFPFEIREYLSTINFKEVKFSERSELVIEKFFPKNNLSD